MNNKTVFLYDITLAP